MRHIFSILITIFLIVACQQKSTSDFQLSGKISGLKQGTLYLQQLQDSMIVVVDSFVFDGKDDFMLKADIKEPEMLYLVLDRGQTNSLDNSIEFFAEPKPMTLNTNIELFYADAQFEGSQNHDLYVTFAKTMSNFRNKNLEQFEQQLRANKLNKPYRIDSIQKIIDHNTKRMYLYAINFAITNKDKSIAPYIAVTNLYEARTKYLDTIQQQLPSDIANSKYGKMLNEVIQERKQLNID